jgi:hypothetical protein
VGRNTGRLTDRLAAALMVFGDVPMEFSQHVNLRGFFGKQKRRFRILTRKGLLEEHVAIQAKYVAYQITPGGQGALDHWATTKKGKHYGME